MKLLILKLWTKSCSIERGKIFSVKCKIKVKLIILINYNIKSIII